MEKNKLNNSISSISFLNVSHAYSTLLHQLVVRDMKTLGKLAVKTTVSPHCVLLAYIWQKRHRVQFQAKGSLNFKCSHNLKTQALTTGPISD